MGVRRHVTGGLMLAISVVVASCSSPPPVRDFERAKESFDKATLAGAARLAPELFHAAVEARLVLDVELKIQAGRRVKSFDDAGDLALAARVAADKAWAEAIAVGERTLARAQAGTGNVAGGPNILLNGDFAAGLQSWGRNPESDVTVSIDQVGTSGRAWHAQYRKGNWIVVSQSQPLKPNTVYVYEAWVKTTAPIVALYWQTDVGRHFQDGVTYPEWTHLQYAFLTPGWTGQPYQTDFCPVLMKGPGDAWLRDVKVWEFR